MLRWIKKTFDGPQIWLTIGAVMVALSLVVGYHQDQRLADATLAEKIDLPSPVAIQEFSQDEHTNMLAEFQLLAEVDIARAGIRTIGEGSMREAYIFIPAYPLSEGGRQIANLATPSLTALPADPSGAEASGSKRAGPVAILVYDASANIRSPLTFNKIGLRSLGAGSVGEVVLLAGTMFDRTMWQDALTGTAFDAALVDFLGEGTENLLLIAPHLNGKAAVAAAPDLSRLGYVYLAFGLAFFLCGGVVLLKRYIPDPQRKVRKSSVGTLRKPSLPPFTYFQPIVSQEDLLDADQDAPPSMLVPKFVARAAGAVARSRVKSRL